MTAIAACSQDDPVCAPEAVRELHSRADSQDKTIKQYPATGHCIMAEACADKVVEDIRAWLQDRAGKPPTRWRETPLPAPASTPCSLRAMLATVAATLLLLLLAQWAVAGPTVLICLLVLLSTVSATRAHGCGSPATLRAALPPALSGLLLLLFDLGLLDPHWFHQGCPMPKLADGSWADSGDCGEA